MGAIALAYGRNTAYFINAELQTQHADAPARHPTP